MQSLNLISEREIKQDYKFGLAECTVVCRVDTLVAMRYFSIKKIQIHWRWMMASPMRLSPELVEKAKREAMLTKRTVPKQIEFWAYLGKAVQTTVDYSDLIAVSQGLKKIRVEPVASSPTEPEEVFAELEKSRERGELSKRVVSTAVYYEVSINHPGLLDQVDSATGQRRTGTFRNGKFETIAR